MNGAIIINKESGMTSRDVVNRLNRILEMKEIGHIGTLDPMATGILVCLVGRATKLTNILVNHDKEYVASFRLGVETDTLDITGNVLREEEIEVSKSLLEKGIISFKGSYEQEVPMYSAVKVNGRRLYDYARSNEKVTLPKRLVNIYDIKLLSYKDDIVTISAYVSKGTYIRSLIRDIGEKLGTCATLVSLERTKIDSFSLKDSATLDDVLYNKFKLVSINELLKDYPSEEIDPEMLFKVRNGQVFNRKIDNYLLFTVNKEPIALYEKKLDDEDKIKPAVMFYINN